MKKNMTNDQQFIFAIVIYKHNTVSHCSRGRYFYSTLYTE